MPDPGLDLIGEEEAAQLVEVIRSGRRSRIRPVERGMLPATNALLACSMSFAIGVVDPDLAPFGLRMCDAVDVAERQAERFRAAYLEHVA